MNRYREGRLDIAPQHFYALLLVEPNGTEHIAHLLGDATWEDAERQCVAMNDALKWLGDSMATYRLARYVRSEVA